MTRAHFDYAAIYHTMESLGYKKMELGACNGFTMMWMQAILSHDEETFYKRVAFISQTKNMKEIIAIAQSKIKQSQDLTEQDKMALSVLAFFDGVKIHQLPQNLAALLGRKHDNQKAVEELSTFTQSDVIEEGAGICEIFAFEQLELSARQWTNYFSRLANVLSGSPEVAVVISTYNHKMGLKYDPKQDEWILFDIRYLPCKVISAKEIGEEVVRNFSDLNIANRLMTRIYSTKKYAESNQEIVKSFAELKQLSKTEKKVTLLSDEKISTDVSISNLSLFSRTTSQCMMDASTVLMFEKLLCSAQGEHLKGVEWKNNKITVYSQFDRQSKYAIRDFVEALNIPIENVSGRYYFHVRIRDVEGKLGEYFRPTLSK